MSLLLLPGRSSGDDITWTNTASGDFANADNWDGAVPGSADKAIIKLDSTLTVDFNADAETDMLQIGNLGVAPAARPKILFDLGDGGAGYTYNVVGNATPSTAIAIGGTKNAGDPGDMATLVVTGGKLVTTNGTNREIRIAYNFANGTTGRLVVSGEHARVQSDILRTARNAETGHLVIEGGATVAVKTMTPGLDGGSTCDSRITVRDPGTTFELGQLYRHSYGRLVIVVENGAEIIGSTQWQVADKPLSDANVLVTGSGSRATTGNFYTMCWSASSNRNTTVIVADGGRIDSTAVLNQFTYGTAEYLVKDAGSQWNASSTFYLAGRNATTPQGDDVVLVVGEGACVTSATMYVHHAGRLYGQGRVAATSISGVINRGGARGAGPAGSHL